MWVPLHCYFLIATVCSSFNPINEGGGRSVPGLQRGDLLATHGHAHIMLVEVSMLALAVSASLSLSPLFCLCRSPAHRRTHATRYVQFTGAATAQHVCISFA